MFRRSLNFVFEKSGIFEACFFVESLSLGSTLFVSRVLNYLRSYLLSSCLTNSASATEIAVAI